MQPIFISDIAKNRSHCFRDKLDREPFEFQHRLSEDPIFDLARLQALAARLPGKVHLNGKLAIEKGWQDSSTKKHSFQQSFDNLRDGQSWIILKRVHEDAEYSPIIAQCLAEIEKLSERRFEHLIESRTMSLILSSPRQLTPYHIDGDCNFLFQIQGCKMFYVFNGKNRSILPEEEEEAFWAGDINAAKFREEHQPGAWAFELKPGNGVHVPVTFPHWVKNGDNISVSLSVNFKFRGQMRANVFRMNHVLRRFGLRPSPVGNSKAADSMKALAFGAMRAGIQAVRRFR